MASRSLTHAGQGDHTVDMAPGPITEYVHNLRHIATAPFTVTLEAFQKVIALMVEDRSRVKTIRKALAEIKGERELIESLLGDEDVGSPHHDLLKQKSAFLLDVVNKTNREWITTRCEGVAQYLEEVKKWVRETTRNLQAPQPQSNVAHESTSAVTDSPRVLTGPEFTTITVQSLENPKMSKSIAFASLEIVGLRTSSQLQAVEQVVEDGKLFGCSQNATFPNLHLYRHSLIPVQENSHKVCALNRVEGDGHIEDGETLHIVVRPHAYTLLAVGVRIRSVGSGAIRVLEYDEEMERLNLEVAQITAGRPGGALYSFGKHSKLTARTWLNNFREYECDVYLIPREA